MTKHDGESKEIRPTSRKARDILYKEAERITQTLLTEADSNLLSRQRFYASIQLSREASECLETEEEESLIMTYVYGNLLKLGASTKVSVSVSMPWIVRNKVIVLGKVELSGA